MTSKIVFVGNTTAKNEVADTVFRIFLSKLNLKLEDVYITSLIKAPIEDIKSISSEELLKYENEFYDEMKTVKPLLVVFMSTYVCDNLDVSKLRCPVIKLKHPSAYHRLTGEVTKAAETMYYELSKFCIFEGANYKYNIFIDYVNNTISFKCEGDMINFISKINNMKIVNISVDGEWTPVINFIANKINFYVGFKYKNYCWVECSESECERRTLKGEPCKKFPYEFQKELPENKEIYEKDIHQDYRFIIDFYDYFEPVKVEELRHMNFDIETNRSVDVINTPGEIISIVYAVDDEYKFLFLNNGKNNYEFFDKMNDVKVFDSEKTMLEYFISVFRTCNVVSGFNIDGFDLIYLVNRASKLGIDSATYSPINRIRNDIIEEKDRMESGKLAIYGLETIDTMLYARDKYFIYALDKPSQMNLDYLGNFLKKKDGTPLGSKVHDSRGPYTLWQEDPLRLYEYNIQDVKLCRDIEDYMGLLNYLLSFKSLISTFNIKWSLYNSKIIDFLILCNYSNKYVFPSKGNSSKEELTGGYVKEPVSGLYKNVAVFDFNSLYPNIIRNFNLSYETISSDKEEFENYIDVYDEVTKEHFYINKDKQGFLPTVVDSVMHMKVDLGNKLKAEGTKEALTAYNAIKSVINSIYGVFAYRRFRMYDIRIARAITAIGRTLTKQAISFVDSTPGYLVLTGDTDSLFAHDETPKDNSKAIEDFLVFSDKINENITEYISTRYGVSNKYIEMECETVFDRFLQTQAKKKYYGVGFFVKGKHFKEEKIYSRGTDLVKKDTPVALRPYLNTMLLTIVKSNCDNDIKQAIVTVKNAMLKLHYHDLLITKQISRNLDEYKVQPQHVRAFVTSNKYLGTNFSRANYKGGMLHVIPNKKYGDAEVVMLNEDVELPDDLKINRTKYFELFVENKLILFSPIFEKFFSKNQSLDMFLAPRSK